MKLLQTMLDEDRVIKTGLVFILASTALFFIAEFNPLEANEGTFFGFFCGNFMFSVVYFFIMIFKRPKRLAYWVLLFLLWFISAFALNRCLTVFDNSVPWLCVVICLSCAAVILALFMEHLGSFARHVVMFLLGPAILLFVYYSVYLTSMYIIGLVAAIGLGISLHVFAPIALAITTFIIIKRSIGQVRSLKVALVAGLVIPVIACTLFIWQWSSINKKVNLAINHNTLSAGKLPAWVVISQNTPKNAIAERIIKADLVYKTANLQDNWFWGGMHANSFDEPLKHDPFVVIASLFSGQTNLDVGERIRILKAMYDSRHKAQERLRSGDKLKTASVVTNIKIFPEYRLAYTEKTLFIKNYDKRNWMGSKEAIYTFHIPEGAVVSSLSLWIDGKEAQSRLTTKAKADSAYKTIVGVEARDPSVVHWQEGNTVSARIFPCNALESRKFRIGVTSPLKQQANQLVYENVYFDGPPADNATETIQLAFSKKPALFALPGFDELSEGVFTADRAYEPGEDIAFAMPQLADSPFTFAGCGYRLMEYKRQYAYFEPDAIYLDINSSWTTGEFDNLWETIRAKNVYYYDGELKKLTAENKADVFKRAVKLNFSLFPVYEIKNPETSLLITKSPETSPNLNDLDESEFQKHLTAYLAAAKPLHLFNIGTKLTPYLKALKEMRVFVYDNGELRQLQAAITQHRFLVSQEDDKHVVLDETGLIIAQTSDTTALGNAPDHLLRLFAYNDIMKKVGPHYFDKTYVQPDIIKEAEQAYIASPVSSLIVLETQQDYERFGIDDNKNSLKNASMKSSGAVPEPGEWLLVLIAIVVINFLVYRAKYVKQTL
jgi:XrtN system VIT domain protein